MELTDVKSMDIEELTEYLKTNGFAAYRAKQLFSWMHEKLVTDYEAMTNLPKDMKEFLKQNTFLTALKAVRVQVSKEDGTSKYLFELRDGNLIESVLMHYHHGNSVCISSQVGCRMGCRFCASTIDGLVRGLAPSEMLDQIYRIQALTGERVSNVVVMGSGEPFDNFENFVKFSKLLSCEEGINISGRNLTVSTCGIVPRIKELADMHPACTLAVSLHSPTDEMRKKLMPVANKYSIAQIMEACRYFIEKTGRRVTFEYSLVKGENDSQECADILSTVIKGMNCHVNLIPVNPIKEREYRQSTMQTVQAFKNKLEKKRINVTIRREMGRDIDGACGQLRRSYSKEHQKEQQ